ncbi:MAG: hypothetical protein N3E48_02010 [Candidatus Bathyarchaeota archaeon]|nr:hypothetical protein [Candidatus Bathyarchaeota archaeon]
MQESFQYQIVNLSTLGLPGFLVHLRLLGGIAILRVDRFLRLGSAKPISGINK